MDEIKAVEWVDGKVRLLDQTQLPNDLVLLEISDHHGIVNAIKRLSVRGAPAIGIAAAYGVVLSIWNADETDRAGFLTKANNATEDLKASRPTAKNLFWALESMRKTMSKNLNRPLHEVKKAMLRKANFILEDDIERCQKMGRYGAELLPIRANVLTHCNAGALATGGHGTALGVIRSAIEMGKQVNVYVDETRPLLQGARLTAFELFEDDIDFRLICDNMAATVMKQGLVNCVVVGADRVAANGDIANKIGTYGLSVLAKEHNIPFYVAAPLSTFDYSLKTGDGIPIEERDSGEIKTFSGTKVAPDQVKVYNPAFDVTPHQYITAIITERGVIKSPDVEKLAEWNRS